MSAAGGGGPNLNAWKALLDFSTRHTEPEPNPDIKPMSKGAVHFNQFPYMLEGAL